MPPGRRDRQRPFNILLSAHVAEIHLEGHAVAKELIAGIDFGGDDFLYPRNKFRRLP